MSQNEHYRKPPGYTDSPCTPEDCTCGCHTYDPRLCSGCIFD